MNKLVAVAIGITLPLLGNATAVGVEDLADEEGMFCPVYEEPRHLPVDAPELPTGIRVENPVLVNETIVSSGLTAGIRHGENRTTMLEVHPNSVNVTWGNVSAVVNETHTPSVRACLVFGE